MEKEKVKNITNIKEENPNFKDKILKQIESRMERKHWKDRRQRRNIIPIKWRIWNN